MPVEFSVFDHMDRGGFPLGQLYADRLRLVEAYEAAGFHTYFLAEHHATTLGNAPAPGVFLAAVAQRTTRLRFGPMVYVLPVHDPLRLIEEICMLDQMSGGRFELGVGRGSSPYEIAYFGVNLLDARPRFREALEVILAGLAGGRLGFEGRFFKYDEVPMVLEPVQKPHPPLWYGLTRPDSAPWPAAKRCNVVMTGPNAYVRRMVERYLPEFHAAHGKDAAPPRLATTRHIYVAETKQAAEDAARRGYDSWFKAHVELWRAFGSESLFFPGSLDEALRVGTAMVGTPDMVRDQIARALEETGTNCLIGRFAFGDIPVERVMRSVELFAAEIMPAFAGAAAPAAA